MKISDRTLQILTNMGTLHKSVVFKAGNVILHKPSDSSNPLIKASVEEKFPVDFQIYDISKFVNLVKMFDEPDLEISEYVVRIRDANGREAEIKCADLQTLRGAPNYNTMVRLPTIDAEFTVPEGDWKALQKSSSIVDAPQMAFIGDGSRIRLSTFDVYNGGNDKFSMEVGDTTHNFKMIIDTAMLKLLPGDYNVKLSFKGVAELSTYDLTYWVAANEKSKYA